MKKKNETGPGRKKPAQAGKAQAGKSSKPGSKAVKSDPQPETFIPAPDGDEGQTKPGLAFPVVGIGASAGGLEASESFFKNMPSDSGMAFVIIVHLDPSHASMMKELLGKYTKMKVCEAREGMKLELDSVYVIPPNKYMAVFDGTLYLSEPQDPRGLRMPIDFFLRSLAADQADQSICVILSGSGSDGTLGLRAIHGAGGVSFVQDPATSKYTGMPQSAIDTGLVDYTLPAEKIPGQLIAYVKHSYPRHKEQDEIYKRRAGTTLQKILDVIREQTGHDFSFYKKNTINRRIERRMNVLEMEDDQSYLRHLQEHPEEVKLLFKEMLINVTSFFRDKEAFDYLKEKAISELLLNKPPGYSLRVWVPGCATGEEVYSVAIILKEVMNGLNKEYKIQIFGTDIDEDSINHARAAFYPKNIAIDVSPERLKKFFVNEDNGYRVKKEIRESVVFAIQNVVKDAPFTKMDLISCRNLLIYMDAQLQNKVLPLFHFSLLPGGVLFLGSSESIGSYTDLFATVDKKWKIFRRRESATAVQSTLLQGLPWTFEPGHRERGRAERKQVMHEISISDVTRNYLLDHFTPPCVITDEKGDIVYVHGRTGNFLEPAQGKANLNVFDMAREGLQVELRTAFHQAKTHNKEVRYENLRVKTNGDIKKMNLTVRPLSDIENIGDLLMVILDEGAPAHEYKKKEEAKKPAREKRNIEELQEELKNTRSSLQATIEEAQASNEELKSTNEELQSTNEELQSTNEELETSKEELQSVNEELITVNSELQAKIDLLSRTESDLKYLLDSTNIGIIFLDEDLKIKRFTREVAKYINLIPSDVNRPLADIVTNLETDIVKEARTVLQTLAFKEMEVKTKAGKWLLVRIMPFRNLENVIDGVVLTFTDIDIMKKNRRIPVDLEALSTIIDNIPQGIALGAPDGRIVYVNRFGLDLIGRHDGQPEKMSESEQVEFWGFRKEDKLEKPSFKELPLSRAIFKSEQVKDEVWTIQRPDESRLKVVCEAMPVRDNSGKVTGGILNFREIQ